MLNCTYQCKEYNNWKNEKKRPVFYRTCYICKT